MRTSLCCRVQSSSAAPQLHVTHARHPHLRVTRNALRHGALAASSWIAPALIRTFRLAGGGATSPIRWRLRGTFGRRGRPDCPRCIRIPQSPWATPKQHSPSPFIRAMMERNHSVCVVRQVRLAPSTPGPLPRKRGKGKVVNIKGNPRWPHATSRR